MPFSLKILSISLTLFLVCLAAKPALGERLVFELLLGPIPVGEAVMESAPAPGPGGEPALRLTVDGRVSSFIGFFFPGTTWLEALTRADFQGFYTFHKKTWHGRNRNDWKLLCEPGERLVRRITRLPEKWAGELRQTIPEPSLDPLSGLWFVRGIPLEQLSRLDVHLVDGLKAPRLSCFFKGTERLDTPLGTFDARVFELPMAGLDGLVYFRPDDSLLVWATPDAARIPLRMEIRRSGSTRESIWQARLMERTPDEIVRPAELFPFTVPAADGVDAHGSQTALCGFAFGRNPFTHPFPSEASCSFTTP